MRLSKIRAGAAATVAAIALAACGGHAIVPSTSTPMSTSALSPMTANGPLTDNGPLGPLVGPAVTTCATSPPQYQWIFKGACVKITLKPAGAPFSLQTYQNVTIKGSIGQNNVNGSATIYIADATGNSDIMTYGGKSFPKYKARGTTFIYAVAINESNQAIKPIAKQGKPILQYVITDSKGLPGKTCGAGLLTKTASGKLQWTALPVQAQVKGNTVTISQYTVPQGFELPSKTPLYFGVNCF